MADTFTGVELSRPLAPSFVETLDFNTIYAVMLAQLRTLLPDFDADRGNRSGCERAAGRHPGRDITRSGVIAATACSILSCHFAGRRTMAPPQSPAYDAAMQSVIVYMGAALAEIAGCFAFWAWLRMAKSPLWLLPGCASLVAFAYLLTRVDSADAGRAYAAYGGIYITFALLWLWAAEGIRPDRWDLCGASLCLVGAAVIFFGPHRA